MRNIFSELKKLKDQYFNGRIEILGGLDFSQYETLERIEFYTNSKYLTGEKDEVGRKKPFYNIVNGAVNIAIRATDFDTKDIKLEATEPKFYIQSMLLSKELFNWMEETNFAKVLNEMGEARARYGGVILKKTEKDDNLYIESLKWKNVITDQVDISNGVIVETHNMTQVELAKKRGVWPGLDEYWDDVMEFFEKKTKNAKTEEFTEDRITVYEIEGEFPTAFMDEENGEDYEYSLQKYFIVAEEGCEYILYQAEVKDTQYKYLPWEDIAGRGLGKGIVEEGFEAQRWVNDSKIKERDVMELASKMIFKSTDDKVYENLLRDLDNGSVINLEQGTDINPVNTVSNSIPAFDANIASWVNQFKETTSTIGALSGEEQPSGTPLGVVQIQNQEARSIFDYRREQAGIFLEEVIEEWVLPHLLKKLKKKHILNAGLSTEELDMIDNAFSTWQANEEAKKQILAGQVFTMDDYNNTLLAKREKLTTLKERRFLEIPDNFYDDIEVKVNVVTTNEQLNKQVALQSMAEMIKIVGTTPQVLTDPVLSQVFGRMVELAGVGISPAQVISAAAVARQAQTRQTPNVEGLAEQAGTQQEAPVTEEERALTR